MDNILKELKNQLQKSKPNQQVPYNDTPQNNNQAPQAVLTAEKTNQRQDRPFRPNPVNRNPQNTNPQGQRTQGQPSSNNEPGSPVTHIRKPPRYRGGSDRGRRPGARKLVPIQRPQKESNGEMEETMKIIPLGGLGEVGRNMCVIEYKEDIIIIDAGFGFPEEDMPGIDYTIPNISYLEGKQSNIRGVVFTHGHMDHVGALPYLLEKLGNPPLYAAHLTEGIIIRRLMEFPNLPPTDINSVKAGDIIKLGSHFEVEFFHVNHNIPDDTALIITTPAGRIVHTADFKFDPKPLNEEPADLDFINSIGDRGISVLMSDSTGAEKDGSTISESVIQDNLEVIFQESAGMIVVGTFSSLINRIQQLISLAEKYDRKVIFDGFSLKNNVAIAKELNQIHIKNDTQASIDQIDRFPRSKVIVIGTGAQGEGNAVLMRVATGEHRYLQIQKGDSVVFSSSVIPGNERSVQRLKDMFYRMGARVYHRDIMDIHASGHAQRDDLRRMIGFIRPKTLMPIHGFYSMMVSHGELGKMEGIADEDIIIADNGSIVHINDPHFADKSKNISWWFDTKSAPSENIMVDGLGIGDIGNVVLRDRQVLAEDGMFVIVALIDAKTGKLRTSPDIISRGFVYLKENKELLANVRKKIKFVIDKKVTRPINWQYLKDALRDEVGLFLFQKTERRPMVLPVVIEV